MFLFSCINVKLWLNTSSAGNYVRIFTDILFYTLPSKILMIILILFYHAMTRISLFYKWVTLFLQIVAWRRCKMILNNAWNVTHISLFSHLEKCDSYVSRQYGTFFYKNNFYFCIRESKLCFQKMGKHS